MRRTLRRMPVLILAASSVACANADIFHNPCATSTRFAAKNWKLPTVQHQDSLNKTSGDLPPGTIMGAFTGPVPKHLESGYLNARAAAKRAAPATPQVTAATRGTVASTATPLPPPSVSAAGNGNAQPQMRADSLHQLPPDLADFADTNNWCTAPSPEFQDAQRFVQEKDIYGPLAQTLSNPQLADWHHTVDFESGYRTVAVVYVWPDDGTKGVPYQNLRLVDGLNCVFLAHAPGASWTAKISPSVSSKCDPNSAEVTAAPALPVAVEDSTEPPGTIPPVTRFVQANDRFAFVGVRCGARWCNIGGNAADLPASIVAAAPGVPAAIAATPQIRVKGWFDEQRLAVDADGRTPPLQPSQIAAIVPVRNLRFLHAANFHEVYHDVAYTYFGDASAKYAAGFGMSKGWNRIQLRELGGHWRALIYNANGDTTSRPVNRTMHTIGSLPGTVRWDWMDYDEWIWISCDVGCCLIQSGTGLGDGENN